MTPTPIETWKNYYNIYSNVSSSEKWEDAPYIFITNDVNPNNNEDERNRTSLINAIWKNQFMSVEYIPWETKKKSSDHFYTKHFNKIDYLYGWDCPEYCEALIAWNKQKIDVSNFELRINSRKGKVRCPMYIPDALFTYCRTESKEKNPKTIVGNLLKNGKKEEYLINIRAIIKDFNNNHPIYYEHQIERAYSDKRKLLLSRFLYENIKMTYTKSSHKMILFLSSKLILGKNSIQIPSLLKKTKFVIISPKTSTPYILNVPIIGNSGYREEDKCKISEKMFRYQQEKGMISRLVEISRIKSLLESRIQRRAIVLRLEIDELPLKIKPVKRHGDILQAPKLDSNVKERIHTNKFDDKLFTIHEDKEIKVFIHDRTSQIENDKQVGCIRCRYIITYGIKQKTLVKSSVKRLEKIEEEGEAIQ